jgi:hypothetical protein
LARDCEGDDKVPPDLRQWTGIWTFWSNQFALRTSSSACRRNAWRMNRAVDAATSAESRGGEHNLTFVSLVKIARALGRDVAALTIGLPFIKNPAVGPPIH